MTLRLKRNLHLIVALLALVIILALGMGSQPIIPYTVVAAGSEFATGASIQIISLARQIP